MCFVCAVPGLRLLCLGVLDLVVGALYGALLLCFRLDVVVKGWMGSDTALSAATATQCNDDRVE